MLNGKFPIIIDRYTDTPYQQTNMCVICMRWCLFLLTFAAFNLVVYRMKWQKTGQHTCTIESSQVELSRQIFYSSFELLIFIFRTPHLMFFSSVIIICVWRTLQRYVCLWMFGTHLFMNVFFRNLFKSKRTELW